jgi:hypothetical protein
MPKRPLPQGLWWHWRSTSLPSRQPMQILRRFTARLIVAAIPGRHSYRAAANRPQCRPYVVRTPDHWRMVATELLGLVR